MEFGAMASQYWRALATVWILLLGAESSPWPGPDSISRNRISYPPLNSPAPAPISYDPRPHISSWTEAYGSPSPSPVPGADPVPVPAPPETLETSADVEDDFQSNIDAAATMEEEEKEWTTNTNTASEVVGMTGGNKAGVVFGVLMGGGLLVLAGFVYKKRRDNIRRSRYGYATRRGLL